MALIGKTIPVARGVENYGSHHRSLLKPLLEQGIEFRFYDLPEGYPTEIATEDDCRAVEAAHGELARTALASGCDALALGCLFEPGVARVKAEATAPVIGEFRAAILLSLAYGSRIAFVGIVSEADIADLIDNLGVRQFFSGCYQVDASPLDFMHSSDSLCDEMAAKAAEARQGGAEVIVGYGDSKAIEALRRGSELPVVSPAAASAILAWAMLMNNRVAGS